MTNKTSKQNTRSKLELTIFGLSTAQLISYAMIIWVNYATGHDDNPSDFDWMGSLFPAALFIFFGIINLVCIIVYLFSCYKRKSRPDKKILFITGVLVVLCFLINNVSDYFYYLNR